MEMQIREIPVQQKRKEVQKKQENPHERAERIGRMFEEISEEYGIGAVEHIARIIHAATQEGKKPETSEIIATIENQESRSEFRKKAQEMLRHFGVLTDDSFDLDKFLQREFREFKPGLSSFGVSRAAYLANALEGVPVFLKNPRSDQNLIPAEKKPLLYAPKHTEEAFNIDRVRSANFHIGFWEMPFWLKSTSIPSPGARENFRALDAAIAAVIYHPRYGNGQRDEKGGLRVLNEKGEYVPFNGEWLQKQRGMGFLDPETRTIALDRPLYFLKKHAPTLFEKGLLRSQDFSSRKIAQLEERTRVSQTGQVRLEGVMYLLGREFSGKNIRIDQINDDIASVVELDEKNIGTPIRTFRTFDRDDTQVQHRRMGTSSSFTYDVSKAHTDVRDFNPQEVIRGRSMEEQVRILKDFEVYQKVLRLDNALKQADAPALRSLPPNLFKTLSHSPLIAEQSHRVEAAVKKSGSFALEAAAQLADDRDFLVPTMEVFESLDEEHEPVADILLNTIQERETLLETLDGAILTGRIDDQVARKMRFEINTQFSAILTVSHQKHRQGLQSADLNNLVATLKTHEQSFALFGKIFRDAFKGSATNLRELPGIQLESKKATDLTREERIDIEAIAKENWNAQKPEMTEYILRGLRRAFDASKTRFFEIKKDGALAASIRFDEKLDHSLYAASLNVTNEIRGSGIGDSVMKTVIDMVAKDHIITADVFAELSVGTKYVEEYGCVITGVEAVTGSDGSPQKRFTLRRDDKQNALFEGKSRGDLRQHSAQLQIVRFDMTKGVEEITHEVERRTRQGFVGTRYFSDPLNPNIRFIAFEPNVHIRQEPKNEERMSSK